MYTSANDIFFAFFIIPFRKYSVNFNLQFRHVKNEMKARANLCVKGWNFIFYMCGTHISHRQELRQLRIACFAGGLWITWRNWFYNFTEMKARAHLCVKG